MSNRNSKINGGNVFLILSSVLLLFLLYFLFIRNDPSEPINNTDVLSEKDSIQAVQNAKNDSINTARKENRNQAKEELKSFRIDKDDSSNSAYYQDKRIPEYTDTNFVFPYIAERNGKYWLRLRLQYEGDNLLAIQRATVIADSESFEVDGNWESDWDDLRYWEWLDKTAGKSGVQMMDAIAKAKNVKIKYHGQKQSKERTLTAKEMDIIKTTMSIYDKMR